MKRGMAWPVGIASVLALTVGANVAVMMVARGDPSVAVEPDYYRKGLDYDAVMAQDRMNAHLGWTAEATLSLGDREGTLAVRLRDDHGAPVRGAAVNAIAFHNARSGSRSVTTLAERDSGEYTGRVSDPRRGEWEVRLDARRGSDHFTAIDRVVASAERSLPTPRTRP